jgi:hypothetical protein
VAGYACDPANITATCYPGDLSGAFGNLTIVASDGTVQKLDVPDPALTLDDLIGHSIVIHAADGAPARIACAPIVGIVEASAPAGAATTPKTPKSCINGAPHYYYEAVRRRPPGIHRVDP